MRLHVIGPEGGIKKNCIKRFLTLAYGPTVPNPATVLVSTGQSGADKFAVEWAEENNIPVETVVPDHESQYGGMANQARHFNIHNVGNVEEAVVFEAPGLVPGVSNAVGEATALLAGIPYRKFYITPDWFKDE